MRAQGSEMQMDKEGNTIGGYVIELVIPAGDCYSDS